MARELVCHLNCSTTGDRSLYPSPSNGMMKNGLRKSLACGCESSSVQALMHLVSVIEP